MQINRLFEIVYILMNKKNVTASELAAHFEVSKRTILRDVDTLSMAGVPIYTTQGKGGGISIQGGYVLNKTVVSEEEQNQILFALQGVSATEHIETEGVLRRLRSLFEKQDKDWIEVDFSRWGNSAADKAKFEILKNSIINGKAVLFTYSGSNGETGDRKAYPLKLVFKSKSWYLQAFCLLKSDYRIFKINRMRNVESLSETFDQGEFHIPKIEPSEYQTPNLIDVKLYFEPQAVYRVYDEFNERDIVKSEDGSCIVSMKISNDYWLYDYILSFGAAVRVLEPQSVRDEIVRLAEKIKAAYLT